MKKINNKKGASHFEMVISFVFFIGFVFFIFMVLKPHDTTTIPNTVVAGLYNSFEEKTRTNLSNVFLKVNYTGPNSCFFIKLPDEFFRYSIDDANSYVTKLDGTRVNSSLINGKLRLIKDGIFFRVAISPEFGSESLVGCGNCNDYELGQPIEREVVSYNALISMNGSYFNNYEELKKELKVSQVFDFAIVTENLPINMEPKHSAPNLVDVIAREYVLEVLKSDGTLTSERFSFRIW